MDYYGVVLRILHIASGVFWAGSAFFFFWMIEPTATALGADSQKFMHHLIAGRQLSAVILTAATINVTAGGLLYWRASGGLSIPWITSPVGITFTVGALAAITAWLIGLIMVRPNVDKADRLGSAMAGAGRPPIQEELAEFGSVQQLLHRLGQVVVLLLAVAVIAMATARYIRF